MSSERPKNSVDVLIERYLRGFPDLWRIIAEIQQEIVQSNVWIVGIASALLAFIASKDNFAAGTPKVRAALAALLFATVLMGALHRVIYQVVQSKEKQTLYLFQLTVALLPHWDVEDPEPSSDADTREQLIEAYGRLFGVDASWMDRFGIALPGVREAYDAQYKVWKEQSTEKYVTFQRVTRAIAGRTLPPKALPSETPSDPAELVFKPARAARAWRMASFAVYGLGMASFVGAIALLMATVLHRG